jgi:hypothetical protein
MSVCAGIEDVVPMRTPEEALCFVAKQKNMREWIERSNRTTGEQAWDAHAHVAFRWFYEREERSFRGKQLENGIISKESYARAMADIPSEEKWWAVNIEPSGDWLYGCEFAFTFEGKLLPDVLPFGNGCGYQK